MKTIFIVAKEDTIGLAASSFDLIKESTPNYDPIIILITPLEEIIFKKKIKIYLKSRKYISCWQGVKKYLNKNDLGRRLKELDEKLFNKIQFESLTDPSQIFDINKRLQFKKKNLNYFKNYLYACSLHLHDILSNNKNSIIIDFSIYDISRSILLSVSNFYDISYRSIIRSRYKNYIFRTERLGEDVANILAVTKHNLEEIKKAKKEIEIYKKSNDITQNVEKKFIIKKFSIKETQKTILFNIRRTLSYIVRFINQIIFSINSPKLIKYQRYLIGDNFAICINGILKTFRILYRLWKPTKQYNFIFKNFIYFPMPNSVENSDSRFNNGFLSESYLINLLRPYLGFFKLVCKDHRSMLGDRTFQDERIISSINNLVYISEWNNNWQTSDPLNLIRNSDLTICISGTSGLEAALLGKPIVILGKPIYGEYFKLKGKNSQSVYEIVNDLKRGSFSLENYLIPIDLLAKYISCSIKKGLPIDVYYLIIDPFSKRNSPNLSKLINFLLKDN
ncbi:hypothetical protein [Prochlorococcus sp. MIT 0604]|uniref:hypothetical protein n=1 Tax=Prochlorococcus sp. MIT 0604 TaxID=1501268 RepID=UPI0004F6B5F4|nr:hypothetical protein [Prochlorococcus sp. MIT 0604]AIQ95484.1 hypothetical protein EW14_1473 [Prochlorococcus sp. MIT 0604]